MSTPELRPGIYHIVVAFHSIGSPRLTRRGNNVTILPPSAQPDPEQEWKIIPDEDGNIIIQVPSEIRPTYALAYEGDVDKPKEGERVVVHLIPPVYKWHLGLAPGRYNTIQVANSELGIRISDHRPDPPILELGVENQLAWGFERVGDE